MKPLQRCALLCIACGLLAVRGVIAAPFIYIPCQTASSLIVYDVGNVPPLITATVDLGTNAEPVAAAVHPSGSKVYVTGRHGHVYVVDTALNTVVGEWSAPASQSADSVVNPEGTRVYLFANFLWTLDTTVNNGDGLWPITSTELGSSLNVKLAVSPDGAWVYAVDVYAGGSLYIYNAVTGSVGQSLALGGIYTPTGIAVNQQGSRVYIPVNDSSGYGRLLIIDPVYLGTPVLKQTLNLGSGVQPMGIALNPESTLAYIPTSAAAVKVVNICNACGNATLQGTVNLTYNPTGGAGIAHDWWTIAGYLYLPTRNNSNNNDYIELVAGSSQHGGPWLLGSNLLPHGDVQWGGQPPIQ